MSDRTPHGLPYRPLTKEELEKLKARQREREFWPELVPVERKEAEKVS